MTQTLRQRWHDTWRDAGIGAHPQLTAMFDTLTAHYGAAGRHYHNTEHLTDVLDKLDWAKHAMTKNGELSAFDAPARKTLFTALALALWYHDIVYDAKRQDNEAQSRDLFLAQATDVGLDAVIAAQAAQLIDITAHHKSARTLAERIMTDCDLAILGADAASFTRYDDNIRREYAHYPDDIYNAGRAQALSGFLQQEKIFKTAAFNALYEDAARRNLCTRLNQDCAHKNKPATASPPQKPTN